MYSWKIHIPFNGSEAFLVLVTCCSFEGDVYSLSVKLTDKFCIAKLCYLVIR